MDSPVAQRPSLGGLRFRTSLDAGLGAEFLLERTHLGLLQLLADLSLDVVKLGQLRLAHIVQANDVKAKLALDGRIGDLALLQSDHGIGEFLDEVAR